MRVELLTELASGVDALYLSGRASLPLDLLQRLEAARHESEVLEGSPPFQFGSLAMVLQPHAFGKYRYCLDHPFLRLGITDKSGIPALRIQPRAEFLHGAGVRAMVDSISDLLESECGVVKLQVSRIDLFADVQGWPLTGNERESFLCRASNFGTFEEQGSLTGLLFGKRSTGTVEARIYDKTEEIKTSGAQYWKDIWSDRYDPAQPVFRVEFEVGRDALRQFKLSDPHEVLDATGALWTYCTTWLSYRVPTNDATKSRWPVSPYWEEICRATIAENSYGIDRTYKGKQDGQMHKTFPALVGYLARFGALSDSYSEEEMLENLKIFLTRYAKYTHTPMNYRIRQKRRELGLL